MRIVIIEDETPAATRLEKMLKSINADIEIIAQLDSIEASLTWIEHNDLPDLIMMDIHLADGSCFEIFNFTKITCPIIFTTAYDEYAIQAFKVNVIDYLMKPINKTELEKALEKYNMLFTKSAEFDYSKITQDLAPQYLIRFLIKLGQSFRLVDTKDVAYFFTENKMTYLIQQDGKQHVVDFSMEKLETSLDPKVYFRVNRQFIIGINAIQKLHTHSKSRVKIDLTPPSKEECIVSSEKSSEFKRWLTGE
jgi:DNA-binding LytR/AlgR family response regulator